jgi:hypothetical protein
MKVETIDLSPAIQVSNLSSLRSPRPLRFRWFETQRTRRSEKGGVVGRIGGKTGVEWSIGVLIRPSVPLALRSRLTGVSAACYKRIEEAGRQESGPEEFPILKQRNGLPAPLSSDP